MTKLEDPIYEVLFYRQALSIILKKVSISYQLLVYIRNMRKIYKKFFEILV